MVITQNNGWSMGPIFSSGHGDSRYLFLTRSHIHVERKPRRSVLGIMLELMQKELDPEDEKRHESSRVGPLGQRPFAEMNSFCFSSWL